MIRLILTGLALLLASGPAAALQEGAGRSLRWDSVGVEARLDAEGRLHVREHQVMVFDGAWNGGERVFAERHGQRLRVESLARLDPRTGRLHPLREDDDLDDVDDFDRDGERYRWRSRLPEDPPFRDHSLEYVLEYTLANAVVPVDADDGRYLLDHDFLMYDREGEVRRFTLALELESLWRTDGDFEGRWTAVDILPGWGFAVREPLRFAGSGMPATVPGGVPAWLRWSLIAVLFGGVALMGRRFFRREAREGRLDPLPEVEGAAWLEEHVFRYPAELVGAAWDRSTSAPEVAGLLARLVQEGKLGSRVEGAEGDDPVLHLELLVTRDRFSATERPLIDALFFDDRERTDTETVKEHYEDRGFDPANTIRSALEERISGLPGGGKRPRGALPAAGAVVLALCLLVAAGAFRPSDGLPAAVTFFVAFAMGAFGVGFAEHYSRRVTGLRAAAVAFLVPVAALLVGLLILMAGFLETTTLDGSVSPYYRAGPLLLVALTALGLSVASLVFRTARPSETRERLELRRRLAAARAFLEAELGKPDPDLRDAWFPYILAFGLGPRVDQWFRSYGAEGHSATGAAAVAAASHTAMGSSAGSGSWTGGGPAFGGGGGFSGGGVGASWGVAAATVASGVAAPSSGGSAGGAASSGGGGGGGW